jgi:hypothetical protein
VTLLVSLLHGLYKFLLPHAEAFLHPEDQQAYLLHLRNRCFRTGLCVYAIITWGWRRDMLRPGRKERCGSTR